MENPPEKWLIKGGVVYDLKTDSKVYTPITLGRMERWISEGRVKEHHLVWRSGLGRWRKAGDLEELKPFFEKAKLAFEKLEPTEEKRSL